VTELSHAETPHEIITRLRETHSRARLASLTGLTPAKVFNIEKGRVVSDEEAAAIRQVAAAVAHPTPAEPVPGISQSAEERVVAVAVAVAVAVEADATASPAPRPVDDVDGRNGSEDDTHGLSDVDERHAVVDANPDVGVHAIFSESATTQPVSVITAVDDDTPFTPMLDDDSSESVRAPVSYTGVSPTALSAIDGYRRYANSEVQTFKDCRRRWYLGWYRGLRPVRESPVGPRAVGDRVHRVLRRWYVPDDGVTQRTDPRDALERLIVEDWTALVAERDADEVFLDRELVKRFESDANLERAVLAGYVEWLAETGADAEYVIVEPEAYLEAELPGVDEPTKIIAKLDARVRRSYDGVRLWLEHKTVMSLAAAVRTLHLDEQVLHQTLVEDLQARGEPRVVGALYNMLRRVKRGPTAQPPFYQRVEVHHNAHEVASFRRRLTATVRDVAAVRHRLDDGEHHLNVAYPRPTRDCAWKCPFFATCGMMDDNSRVEDAMSRLYVKDDPLSYYTRDLITSDGEDGAAT
jgi:hypothetical protein